MKMPSSYAMRAASIEQFFSLVYLSLAFVCKKIEEAVDANIVPFHKKQMHFGLLSLYREGACAMKGFIGGYPELTKVRHMIEQTLHDTDRPTDLSSLELKTLP